MAARSCGSTVGAKWTRVGGFVIATIFAAALVGCEAGKAAKPASTTNKTVPKDCDPEEDDDCEVVDDGGGDGSAFDLCKSLKANSEIKNNFSAYTKVLCDDGELEDLRGRFYRGTGSGTVRTLSDGTLSSDAGASEMRLVSSSSVPTTPEAYYAMVRLQMMKPNDFKSKGFEVDPDVEYQTRKVGTNDVTYYYERRGEEDIASYVATTKFHTLRKNVAYAHTTLMDESAKADTKLTEKLKGLVIINKSGSDVEVFTISDQQYDNNNNHNATKNRVIDGLVKDQIRSIKNGKDADKALD